MTVYTAYRIAQLLCIDGKVTYMTQFIFLLRYLVHYAGFDRIFNFLPIKVVWSFFVALFRTHAVCNMVALAADTIKAGKIR
jgi:hypothetical protein